MTDQTDDQDEPDAEPSDLESVTGETLWAIAVGEEDCDDPRLRREARAYAAIRLRMQGTQYREIAAHLGLSLSYSFDLVRRAVKLVMQDDVDTYRQMNVMRLEAMLEGVMDRATEGDSFAIQSAIAIMSKIETALGIEPPKQRVVHEFGAEVVDDARSALAKAIAARSAEAGDRDDPGGSPETHH